MEMQRITILSRTGNRWKLSLTVDGVEEFVDYIYNPATDRGTMDPYSALSSTSLPRPEDYGQLGRAGDEFYSRRRCSNTHINDSSVLKGYKKLRQQLKGFIRTADKNNFSPTS